MNNINLLRESILKTLAYYRALGIPLTLVQIGRYMIDPESSVLNPKLSEIKSGLDGLIEEGIIERQKGLYWLKTQNARKSKRLWLKFIRREKIAQRKINKVRWALKFFRYIPGLRGIFVCGSVARKISKPSSDIDFLVLTEKKRVWTARLFLTVFSYLLGKKTDDEKSRRNKFCLNHYRSKEKLKLDKGLQDLYSAQEYAGMLNIYSDGNIENKFYKANRDWMEKLLPNFDFRKPSIYPFHNRVETQNFACPAGRRASLQKTGDILEKFLRKLQTAKILRSSQRFNELDSRRIVSDNKVIMFHLNPRAPRVISRYKKILTTYDLRQTIRQFRNSVVSR